MQDEFSKEARPVETAGATETKEAPAIKRARAREEANAPKTAGAEDSNAKGVDVPKDARTTEMLGGIPRYVLQLNAISRSAHNFSATAKKIMAMATALLPSDLSSLSAAFTFGEFCEALGIPKGGETFLVFKAAVEECMESVIRIETPPDKKGKTSWILHHWFRVARFNKYTGICTMTFDQELADFLNDFKKLYAKINLADIGCLQSKYALRMYETAISYASLQGKNGNKSNTWYFERTIAELRHLFMIDPNEYQETKLFRRKVIEGPIKEINEAGIGMEIKTAGIKKGRNLTGLRFDCKDSKNSKDTKGTAPKKDGKQKKSAFPPQPDDRATQNQEEEEEKELEHLKTVYPDEFAELYNAKLAELPTLGNNTGEIIRKAAAEHVALKTLRERHGIKK
jgi:hypothetical protein